MKLIAHRGNINGKIPERENNPTYLIDAIKLGFDAECDVRLYNGEYYLGHDTPDYGVTIQFLRDVNLWCHAKDAATLHGLLEIGGVHCFAHNNDPVVLTSLNYLWTYPGYPITPRSIYVLPELHDGDQLKIAVCYGICSDFVSHYDTRNVAII